jgi:sec-independent protein translocase protein TatA
MFEGLFQPMHLLVLAGIALLVFGPKKLPELGKGLGEGLRGFKSAMSGDDAKPAQAAAAAPVVPPVATATVVQEPTKQA